MKKPMIKIFTAATLMLLAISKINAQFSLSGQLRTRTEFRDGQGAPLAKDLQPALFTSQRTRLHGLFNTYRLKMAVTVQDVRVWGQDVSMINRTTTQDNNAVMLHEAWAEIMLSDTTQKQHAFNLKIGRQELVYDDQRLLGNLDWLQQARRHDAVVAKFENARWTLHAGGAFNQNKEGSSGTLYNSVPAGNYPATTNGGSMYKSMEFLYAGRRLNRGTASLLFFSDQFSAYDVELVNNNPQKTYISGTWARATTGVYVSSGFDQLDFTASAYFQFGKNGAGRKINGQLLSVNTRYSEGKISIGPGVDFTSADFDPLYGTPHKFWGLMDYYYAGNLFGGTGLVDYYLRSLWKASGKFSVAADLHHFASASRLSGYSRNYGQEIDIVGSLNLTKTINLEAGYSHYFSTKTLTSPGVKNIPNSRSAANWAYLMVNIKPEFLFK